MSALGDILAELRLHMARRPSASDQQALEANALSEWVGEAKSLAFAADVVLRITSEGKSLSEEQREEAQRELFDCFDPIRAAELVSQKFRQRKGDF